MPVPVAAAPAIGFDEVTNGYVPWSRSRSVPCAPSSRLAGFLERLIDEQRSVGHIGAKPLGAGLHPLGELLYLERSGVVEAFQHDVFLRQSGLELLAEDLGVEDVLHPDAEARRLVGVRGTDSSAGRPDLELPEPPLAGRVDRDVPRHDQVGVSRDPEPGSRDSAPFELVISSTRRPGR